MVSLKRNFVERDGLVVILDEQISVLNYEKNFLLRRNVDAEVIKVHDAKSIFH